MVELALSLVRRSLPDPATIALTPPGQDLASSCVHRNLQSLCYVISLVSLNTLINAVNTAYTILQDSWDLRRLGFL